MVLMACQCHFRFDVAGMKRTTFFITGTDTGVGKTVLTALLTRHLRERGVNAVALKPVCSGDRADARALHAASAVALTLDEINPWHLTRRWRLCSPPAANAGGSRLPACSRTPARCKSVLTWCWLRALAVCSVRSVKNLTRAI